MSDPRVLIALDYDQPAAALVQLAGGIEHQFVRVAVGGRIVRVAEQDVGRRRGQGARQREHAARR